MESGERGFKSLKAGMMSQGIVTARSVPFSCCHFLVMGCLLVKDKIPDVHILKEEMVYFGF